jgi:hypothetical protein
MKYLWTGMSTFIKTMITWLCFEYGNRLYLNNREKDIVATISVVIFLTLIGLIDTHFSRKINQ